MCGIDLRIDDGDGHIFSGGPAMDLSEPQLARRVLSCIARRQRQCGSCALLQLIQVVGLRGAKLFCFERAHHLGNLASGVEAEAKQRSARQRQTLRAERRETEPAGRGLDCLHRHVGAAVEDHFAGDETGLATRRHAGEAGFAGKRPARQPIAPDGVGFRATLGARLAGVFLLALAGRAPTARPGWLQLCVLGTFAAGSGFATPFAADAWSALPSAITASASNSAIGRHAARLRCEVEVALGCIERTSIHDHPIAWDCDDFASVAGDRTPNTR